MKISVSLRFTSSLAGILIILVALVNAAPASSASPSSGAESSPSSTSNAPSSSTSAAPSSSSVSSEPPKSSSAVTSSSSAPPSSSDKPTPSPSPSTPAETQKNAPSSPPPSSSSSSSSSSQAPPAPPVSSSNSSPSQDTITSVILQSSTTLITKTSFQPTVTSTMSDYQLPSSLPDNNIMCTTDPSSVELTCSDTNLYFCDPTTHRCVPKREFGMECSNDTQCGSGNCVDEKCAETKKSDSSSNDSSGNDNSSSGNGSVGAKVGIVSGVVVAIICAVGIGFWLFNYGQKRRANRLSRDIIRPSSYARPSTSSAPDMKSGGPIYPFAVRAAGFSNSNPPQMEQNHVHMNGMGDPTQRRTSFYNQGPPARFVTNQDGYMPQPTSPPPTSPLPTTQMPYNKVSYKPNESQSFNDWAHESERYPGVAASPQPPQNNRVSDVSSRLSRYNYLAKAFTHMRTSFDLSRNYSTQQQQQQQYPQSTPKQATENSSEYNRQSVNVVYRVANPQQGKDFRNNLHEAARAIQHTPSPSNVGISNGNDRQQDSALRDSNLLSSDDQDEIAQSTTDPTYLGVSAEDIVEPVDYTSPTGNGRYKMSSMYSTYSRDSHLFGDMPEMPHSAMKSVNDYYSKIAPGSTPVVSNQGNNQTQKDSDNNSINHTTTRASVFTLHAPIFKSYQPSSVPPIPNLPEKFNDHSRNPSQSSLRSQIFHQRNLSQASQQSSMLRHQRDFSQSSQVIQPSPLGKGIARNDSKSSQSSQGSSIYSTNSDGTKPSTPKVSMSPTFGMSTNKNNDNDQTSNLKKLSKSPQYNLDRQSDLSLSGISDISSDTVEAEYNYVLPETGTIEERIAQQELYALSQNRSGGNVSGSGGTSSYAPSLATSEVELEQDLDAIRRFAENAWGELGNGSYSSPTSSNGGTSGLSRTISHGSHESNATVTDLRSKTLHNNEDDYQFY
ncbi:hypothetical protein G9A89_014183 [Geosiphon pyriformis]|nr:hypothetical protein G9A89_014183 [Geosiphon pyriformis]